MRSHLPSAALLALALGVVLIPLTLAACSGDDASEAGPSSAAPVESPVPTDAPPVAPPPETPGQAAHAEGEDHAHSAPHGGTVKEAGSGHLEAVVSGSNLLVYPLDASEALLPVDGITGAQAVIQPQNGSAQTVPLEPMGDHLMATLPEGVRAYTAIVTVPVAGEARSARFEVGLDGDLDHTH
jgi:hypothetical protein